MSAILGNEPSRAYRPDAQAFDEIRIVTVPRYKESEISGDEWRISAEIQFYRNGVLRHTETYRNIEVACRYVAAEHGRSCDDGKAYFAGEKGFCNQEGCHQVPTVRMQLKATYCRHCGNPHMEGLNPGFREFCDKHKRRGDCGIDDSDSNYEPAETVE